MKGCSIFWVIVRKKVAPVHGRQKCRGAWKIFVGAVRLSKSVSLYCGTPNKKPRALDRGQCETGRGPRTKNQKPRSSVHESRTGCQDSRVAGRGPGTIRQGPRVAGDVSRVAAVEPGAFQTGKGDATRTWFNLFIPNVTGLSHTFPSRILFWLLVVDRLL